MEGQLASSREKENMYVFMGGIYFMLSMEMTMMSTTSIGGWIIYRRGGHVAASSSV